MITLITGAPGSGKTLYCIDKIIQPLVGTSVIGTGPQGEAIVYPREIFTNINGLKLPHQLIDAAWLSDLATNKQSGAVVVFDEVQRVWPNRVSGTKKPAGVEYLETHRHDGIDVVLLTQNPQLLDPAVRALVGRHLHMRRFGGIGAAVVYEWDACSNGLNFKSAFAKKAYRYSKRVFQLYDSAKIHTKQRRSLPAALWGVLIGVCAFAYFGPKFYLSLKDKAAGVNPVIAASAPSRAASTPSVAGAPKSNVAGQPQLTAKEYRESFQPRMSSMPHTAPRYEQVTMPVRAPVPAACIQSKSKGCICWTQDATRLFIPFEQCAAIVANGYFLDFVQPGDSGGGVASAGAVHWKTDGVPSSGNQPGQAHVSAAEDESITPGQIANLSRATTGANPWARNVTSGASNSVASKPKI